MSSNRLNKVEKAVLAGDFAGKMALGTCGLFALNKIPTNFHQPVDIDLLSSNYLPLLGHFFAGYAVLVGLLQMTESATNADFDEIKKKENALCLAQCLIGCGTVLAGFLYEFIGTSVLSLCLGLSINAFLKIITTIFESELGNKTPRDNELKADTYQLITSATKILETVTFLLIGVANGSALTPLCFAFLLVSGIGSGIIDMMDTFSDDKRMRTNRLGK